MELRVDRPVDFEHITGRMHFEMHPGRLREAYSLKRLDFNLLIQYKALPPSGEQAADIYLVRRSHNIEEGRPAMGAF